MKPLLLLTLFFSYHSQANSQSIIRYKTPKGIIYSQSQIDSLVNARNLKLKESEMTMKIEILEKENRGDTIFYNYKFNITNTAVDENDKKKNKFLNSELPNFKYKDIKGKIVNSASLKGRPIIINFWFTTCSPCIVEMPELNRLKEKYKTSDIVFLSMTYETKSKVLAFLKKRKFDFQIIPNAEDYCEKFTDTYPINIFVDRNGIIKKIERGMPLIYDAKTKTSMNEVNSNEFEQNLLMIK